MDRSPILLDIGPKDQTFQQSVKQDSFSHILKSSASTYCMKVQADTSLALPWEYN